MFGEPASNWAHDLSPLDLLTIRAVAPRGVFTPRAKHVYLDRVESIDDLFEIAPTLFSSDYEFVNLVPAEWRDQILELVKLAYQKDIRSPEWRVQDM